MRLRGCKRYYPAQAGQETIVSAVQKTLKNTASLSAIQRAQFHFRVGTIVTQIAALAEEAESVQRGQEKNQIRGILREYGRLNQPKIIRDAAEGLADARVRNTRPGPFRSCYQTP